MGVLERARIDGKDIYVVDGEPVQVLGYAVWYTFSRLRIEKDFVKELFDKHDLQEFKPDDPLHEDAFRRVCTEYKESKVNIGGKELKVLIRPIDKDGLDRQIVLESREEDSRNGKRKLKYTVVGEISYVKDMDDVIYTIDPSKVEGQVKKAVENIVGDIIETYEREKDCYTEEHLRKILLRILDYIGKVPLKPSGSIYFVPRVDFIYIEKFAKIIEDIKEHYPDNRTQIWYAPIVDNDYFREMVAFRVEETVESIVNSAIERLIALKQGNFSKSAVKERLRKIAYSLEDVKKTAEKYKGLLKMSMDRIDSLISQAEALLEKVSRELATQKADQKD